MTMPTTTVGQVFLIEDNGTLIRSPGSDGISYYHIDLAAAYASFQGAWGDYYDFVALYVDIPSLLPVQAQEYPATFYHCVYTKVTGINHLRGPNYTERPVFNNSTRLLGVIQLQKDQISRTTDPTTNGDLAPRYVRLHEIGHQWLAYVWFDKGGVASSDLLDPSTLWHWGLKFDCDLSSMGHDQIDWEPDPPNSITQFRERYVTQEGYGYNPLDLYLMGMLSSSDPRFSKLYCIDNLSPPDSRGTGILHSGNRSNLNLTNITNLNGLRVPNAAQSQRSFRQAFVLLTKDLNLGRGRPNVGVLLAEIIEQERLAHITEFRSATESRGVIDTYLYDTSYDGIYIKDNAADTGSEPTTVPFWDSPDIWVRNADDGLTLHQDTKRLQDNFIYVRVRNASTTDSREVTVNVFRANFVGTEFSYPEDWRLEDLLGSQVIPHVPAGGEVITKFRWESAKIPNTTWHPCLLAEVLPIHPTQTNLRHVWEDRRIAQKNLTIIGLDDLQVLAFMRRERLHFPFQIGARSFPDRWVRIRIHQMGGNRVTDVVLNCGREEWLSRTERLEQMSGREGHATEHPCTRPARLSDLVREGGELLEQDDGSLCFLVSDALQGGEIVLPLVELERREVTLSLGGIDLGLRSPASDIRFAITQLNEQNQVVGGFDLVVKRRI